MPSRKTPKKSQPSERPSWIEVETDPDELDVTCRLVGVDEEGDEIEPTAGLRIYGDTPADLLEGLDDFIRLLVEARAEIAAAHAADGEDVASSAGTTSAVPGGGATA
jgi:hypothetical protein